MDSQGHVTQPTMTLQAGPQAGYRERCGSGHGPSKPITDLNRPVYGCGIALLAQDGLTDCVNRY